MLFTLMLVTGFHLSSLISSHLFLLTPYFLLPTSSLTYSLFLLFSFSPLRLHLSVAPSPPLFSASQRLCVFAIHSSLLPSALKLEFHYRNFFCFFFSFKICFLIKVENPGDNIFRKLPYVSVILAGGFVEFPSFNSNPVLGAFQLCL